MSDSAVTIVGLPGSGKTTYLAALWAILNERPREAALRFRELGAGDRSYLTEIAKRWRSAHEQERTLPGIKVVKLHMSGPAEEPVSITFRTSPARPSSACGWTAPVVGTSTSTSRQPGSWYSSTPIGSRRSHTSATPRTWLS